MHLPPVDDHMAVTDITGETIEATIFEPGIFRNNQFQFIVAASGVTPRLTARNARAPPICARAAVFLGPVVNFCTD